ncbi:MAG: protein-tyrosine-phosphatase [Bacteroidota bacterium]
MLLPALNATVETLIPAFKNIRPERKELLSQLTTFIKQKVKSNQPVYLNFICTHNSRRSHLSQIWAHAAAYYYDIPNVHCYSGGTEATAFNPRAVKAMIGAGFDISVLKEGTNPVYRIRIGDNAPTLTAFSKRYDDASNPAKDFAAIMTCSHADENCPLVIGATQRIALTYNDPKDFDGTPQEEEKYRERVMEIGHEILYAFSQVNP